MGNHQDKNIAKRITKLETELTQKNRELEIETALERVRVTAMGMKQPKDMIDICRIISKQLQLLKIGNIRNVQTAIINDKKGTYLNYEYFTQYKSTSVLEIVIKLHPKVQEFADTIKKSADAFFTTSFKGQALKKWIAYRKKTRQNADPILDKVKSLHYYFYSIGPGALGLSTYVPLTEEEIKIFHRFRNVFNLAYRRFIDIEKAEAQAREAQIEAALERIRARALAMHNSNELIEIPKVLREQMALLGQPELETSVVHLYEEDPDNILSWRAFRTGTDTNNEVTYGYTTFPKNSCEFVREWLTNFYSDSNEYTIEISGAKQKEWYKVLFKFAPDVINAMRKTKSLHEKRYHQFSKFSGGALLMVSKQPPSEESVHLQKRAAAVFDLAYRRFLDLKKAEAQAREAMIEAALERVRARGMAMQTSEELGALIGTLFTELTKLDLVLTRCVIWIIDHKTNDAVWWMANSEDPSHPMSYFIPYHQEPPWLAFIKEWKKRTVRWVYDLKGQTKKNWDDYLFTKTGLSKMPKFIKDGMKAPERVLLSASFNNFGGMNVASLEPLSNEHYNILLRFAKVFDLTYTRFNDLKQAEAQAKESRIQLALERIRARTMAMQKSDELPETSYLLFQQLKELGETAAQLSIGIIKEGFIELSATIHGSQLLQTYDVAMDEPFVMKKALKAWKAKEKSLVVEFKGKVLKDYNNWRNSLLRKKIVFPEEQWIINIVYFSKGFLSFSSDKQIPGETFQLLERFAGVFDQTYTRFLDLQKAEAQSKESQIQLALERVRARTMAMQRSDELMETAVVLFNQLSQLGENIERTIIGMMNEEERVVDVWATRPDGSQMVRMLKFPIDEPIVMQKVYAAWRQQKKSIVIDLQGEELESYFQFLKGRSSRLKRESLGERRVENFAFFSKGILGVINADPNTPANLGLYERFAAVFDQTYTRFLDLQTAEAQAREAQIETGLERVRSRTMGMQKSEELKEIIQVVYEQFVHLNILVEHAGFIMDYKERDDMHIWLADKHAVPFQVTIPYFDCAHWNSFNEAKEKGKDFFANHLSFEEKNKFYRDLFKLIPGIPEETLEYYFSCPGLAISTVLLENVGLYIENFSGIPYTDEENNTLMRFGKVFQQTYTRFLDLQKAEAQAKEAQIEAALERVRSRTMAMHKSDELKEIIIVVSEQLQKLGYKFSNVSFITHNADYDLNFWMSAPGVKEPILLQVPYLNNPVINSLKQMVENDIWFSTDILTADESLEWNQHVIKTTWLKDAPQKTKDYLLRHTPFAKTNIRNKHIAFAIGNYAGIPYPDEENEVFKRFANVFEQSYTRFLDLQKAEAQAREAQIELGLERVRARAMAMQKSGELSELVDTVFKELTKLDFALTWCIINIIDESSMSNTVWAANPDINKAPESYHMLFEDYPFHHAMMKGWKERKTKYVHTLEGSEKKIYDDYLFSETEFKRTPEAAQAASRAMEKYVVSFSFSNFGGLQTVGDAPLSDANLDILSRFGKVFDLTYTRFNDLKQAEEQAREAQIQLALERVRARTMAMQKSDELPETSFLLFQQVKELGLAAVQNSIGIVNEEAGFVELSTTVQGHHLPHTLNVPIDDPYVMAKAVAAWKAKQKSLKLEFAGQELKNYNEHRNSFFETKVNFPEDQWIVNIIFFSKGWLSFSGNKNISGEIFELLKRFAAVFEQTYIRFNDLKQAEEQVRESQIQLALERVRARTMAMHRSEELAETAQVMFLQLQELGGIPDRIAIGVADEANGIVNFWSTDQLGSHINKGFKARLNERTVMSKTYQAWKDQKKSLVVDLHGDDVIEWVKFAREEMGVIVKDEFIKDRRVHHFAFFSHGWILVTSHEPQSAETIQILERFASVFNLTYRRFLDLQNAEAQAREAQIEAALEKVRASAMAMHMSDDLHGAVTIMFEEFQKLNLDVLRCGIGILNKDSRTGAVWATSVSQNGLAVQISANESFDTHPLMTLIYEYWQKQEDLDYVLQGQDLIDYYRAMEASELKLPASQLFLSEDELQPQYYYAAMFTAGGLYAFRNKPFAAEDRKIMKRFASVVNLTYNRFLDLQKAEAQAREAQIEAALERVRSKTMAMHNSQDVGDTVATMFDELVKLNIETIRCGIAIIHDITQMEVWTASSKEDGSVKLIIGQLDMRNHPLFMQVYNAWKNKDQVSSYELIGEDLKDYFRAINNSPNYPIRYDIESLPYQQSNTAFMFPEGSLFVFSGEPLRTEASQIFKRFAGVFGQTYRRYLDLQKAEANAREARIEASLERVRAKAMAMHNSKDLAETLNVFYRELKSLSVIPIRCGVALMDKETQMAELTTMNTTEHGDSIEIVGTIKMTGHPVLDGVFENWLVQKEYHAALRGNQIKEYYQVLKPQISYLDYSNDEVQFGYYFMFKEGDVYAWTEKELTEDELNIYRRFTTVISLTYKRYKDLQQAEAQAREAKIEAGLERVRARTMAMHGSDDVSTATATMFTELEKLGIENLRGGITIIRPDQTQEVWSVTNMADGKTVRAIGVFDMKLHPLWRALFKGKEREEDYQYYWMAGQDKQDYINILNATPNYLTQPIKEFPDVHVQSYFFGEGAVWTNSLLPHSEEDKQVMKRFASVFSLTFRRYQDLRKAEAQAREATIEAALEKVRGKAMSMHNSNDLSVTTSMIISELRKLGIKPIRCGVGIISKETHKAQLYTATSSADGDSLSVVGWVLLKGHPVLENIYEKWLAGEDYFPELSGDSRKAYYEQLLAGLSVPLPDFKDDQKHYGHFFSFSVGCLYGWADVKYNDDEIKILKRFASIIDLTFRRYFELQKSEANAREAVKQAALDRIRADIASMRTISDLDRITPLIWNELTILGIPFIRCGVFLMDDLQQLIHTFLSTPEGKAIAAFHLPYDTPGNLGLVVSNWKDKTRYVGHWNEKEFYQFAEILVREGALDSAENYLKTIPHGGFYLHFLPFLQGMLYVGNTEQLNEEQIGLIQHVADAFSTAYARYEDFNKLEAAKQQVEKTLTDLKQAQTQLVQSEKMASLGELTAGIAHEIQNPLNFVNNFSDVSNELLEEMRNELEKGNKEDAMAIVEDVKQNLEKILHHGKRADAIVKGMLQHSRTSSGQKEPTDINILADEYLRLAFHGLRAKDKSFNAKFDTDFDNSIGKINIIPQDIGRVILNLINNAFYAVTEKKKAPQPLKGGAQYEPIVTVTTKKQNGKVEIKVKDNGNGIPQKVLDKIFQPFFTTKPTGQGTGLGLSLSYDIVTKGHGGELKVETHEGEGSEFIIQLPYTN